MDLAARRTHQAARLRAESEILSFLAGSVLRGETSLEALLERVRETFGMESVALLERASDVDPWTCAGSVGTGSPSSGPRTPTSTCRSATTWRSRSPAGCCPPRTAGCWPPSPRRPPWSWTGSASSHEADQARALAEGNRIRTALLAAVSHDLRTPLAGIKAAVSRCAPTTWPGPRRTGPSCWRASRTAPTASTTWWATCWTCPGSRPARSPR